MQTPQVNIMLPVYNGMPLLAASIESIRRQSYTNWQCIVCDDGSTDGTWEYLQSVLGADCHAEATDGTMTAEMRGKGSMGTDHNGADPRFILMRNDRNMGRGYTRQRILEACTASYVCMLDSGDLMHPDRLQRQVDYLEAHPRLGLVSTAMLCFGTHTDTITYQGEGRDVERTFDGHHTCNFAPTMFRNFRSGQAAGMMDGAQDGAQDGSQNGAWDGSQDGTRSDSVKFRAELRFCEDQHFLRQYLTMHPCYGVMEEPLYYYSIFDSVTKRKMRRGYLQDMSTFIADRQWLRAAVCLLKVVYASVVFPFVTTEKIIVNRSAAASQEQISDFNKYARPLL